ncbi:hypothetical protein A2U01_0003115 [Trifolium medium]|uniref:Uncharacterized protein n=1 Tax=Trifolium medium TaxID=97028 RepID=A0A392M5F1_9FABA|nr:hypothetical protein [Trifolium medium]
MTPFRSPYTWQRRAKRPSNQRSRHLLANPSSSATAPTNDAPITSSKQLSQARQDRMQILSSSADEQEFAITLGCRAPTSMNSTNKLYALVEHAISVSSTKSSLLCLAAMTWEASVLDWT